MRPSWDVSFFNQGRAHDPALLPPGVCGLDMDPPGFRLNSWENLAVPLKLATGGYDLYHAASSSAPWFASRPIVMTVHDLIPLVFDDGHNPDFVRRFAAQLRSGVRIARRIIAVSENTKKDLCRCLGVAPERISVVHWGTDIVLADEFSDDASEAPYALAFAGAARRKNTLGILRVFLRAALQAPSLRLIFVGLQQGALRDQAVALARQAGVEARLELRSYVSEEELGALYRHASAVLYLSYYEGFGLPLLEAMGRGAPIIAADRTSIPEIVGDAAILVDPDDEAEAARQLVRLTMSAGLRQEMRERGYARCREFTWRETAQRTIAVLEAAV